MSLRQLISPRRAAVALAAVAVLIAVSGLAPSGLPWSAQPAWAFRTCQITRDREIHLTHAPFLTCAKAKAVLVRLKGHSGIVPMACSHPLTVMGWHITVTAKEPGVMASTYTRGRYSFQYMRPSTPRHSCDPKTGDEPDA